MAKAPRVDKSAPNGENPAQDVDKTPVKTPVDQPHGGALLVGNPGNKGGSGRPPNEWKAKMAKLADRWQRTLEAEKVLEDPEHEHFMAAGKFCAEQAHGAAAKRVTLEGDADKPVHFDVVVRREA